MEHWFFVSLAYGATSLVLFALVMHAYRAHRKRQAERAVVLEEHNKA